MRTVPAELAARYAAEGWWTDDTLGSLLAPGLAGAPDAAFRVHSAVRPWSGTYRDVELLARRLAAGLRSRGVGPGDVVCFQLPNWMEAAVTFWAAAFLGAVIVPVTHIYGRKEVTYILSAASPTVFITARKFGRLEYQPDLVQAAAVPVTGVVGLEPGDPLAFESLLADEPMRGELAADPASVALVAFTSGTTSNPKGVIHSHQTLGFEARQGLRTFPPNTGGLLGGAPVGHFIGMLGSLLYPVLLGWPIHLLDTWDPARVLSLMADEGLSVGGGTPYYVTSLLDHPSFTPAHLASMQYAGFGGAPVPPAVAERISSYGITVHRSYGSTEHPSITGSALTDPAAKRLYTDGKAKEGVEVRLAADGEVLSRGADLCLGYTDPALTAAAFDRDGWYHTGDLAVIDDDGYLTITGRKSDMIIRGGENISALEIEDLLLGLPGVAEAAVVAVPDTRLGERAVAVLRMRPGFGVPTLEQVRGHLQAAGLTRQKWPEQVHGLADFGRQDFPRTASGKVQKYLLRQDVAGARPR
jgi:acyl-CoA synthetase (AMP-forming)/AMP-acid ligase II